MMNSRVSLLLLTMLLYSLAGPAVSPAADEPSPASAPTVTDISYFSVTVDFEKPVDAEGVLVVARQSYSNSEPPYDGVVYSANSRLGDGDPTDPNCLFYCEYVVADSAASGSLTITGLKEGINHYFAVYAYNGSGAEINYNRTINETMAITAPVPLQGMSHNELWVAANSPKDGTAGGSMTGSDCAACHGTHHTSQLLPTGMAMYDKCFTCHNPAGAASAKSSIGLHPADGAVDCGACHSMHAFLTEELYSNSPLGVPADLGFNRSFVRANMAKLVNTGNGFTVDALEPTVFPTQDGFGYTTSSGPPYNGVCQTCHDDSEVKHYTQTSIDGHQSGKDCISCHTHDNNFLPSSGPGP